MTDHPDTSTPPGFDPGLAAGVVLSLAVALGVAAWTATTGSDLSGEHPLAFAPLRVDQDRLEGERRQKYGEAESLAGSDPADRLLKNVRMLNGGQFQEGRDEKQREISEKISYLANDVIPETGYEAFIAAGQPLFEKCRSGLDSLLSDLRSGDIDLEEARSNPEPGTYGTYRRNCGNLLPILLQRNLVDGSGHWTEPVDVSKTLVDILQRYRWANFIRTRAQPLEQLTDYERYLLMRWRIEDPKAYPLRERRSYLDQLEANSGLVEDYEVGLARARLAYAERDLHRTVRILEKHLREQDGDTTRYERALEWLERRHASDDESRH